MKITVWLTEGTWPDCVDAARDLAEAGNAEITLLVVREQSDEDRRSKGFGSLMGRGPHKRMADEMESLTQQAAETMLSEAERRLGLPATTSLETGLTERVVTAAAQHVDYLIVGRDGDRSRLGPHSLGKHTRFVIDHAPCRVLVIWPGTAPDIGSIPPPPPDR